MCFLKHRPRVVSGRPPHESVMCVNHGSGSYTTVHVSAVLRGGSTEMTPFPSLCFTLCVSTDTGEPLYYQTSVFTCLVVADGSDPTGDTFPPTGSRWRLGWEFVLNTWTGAESNEHNYSTNSGFILTRSNQRSQTETPNTQNKKRSHFTWEVLSDGKTKRRRKPLR